MAQRNVKTRLLIFAKYPVPGRAKTRLIPALGPEGASRLHRRMTERTVDLGRACRDKSLMANCAFTVCSTGALPRKFRAWLGTDIPYAEQRRGDLGTRLRKAFDAAFENGDESVLAIGTDVPEVSPEILKQGTELLSNHDVVLGPAADGGYYLIGMKCPRPELFADVDWGTERVAEQTRCAGRNAGLTIADLPLLHDVDRPEDLTPLREDPYFADCFSGRPLLSVIVPTLNEERSLPSVLQRVGSDDSMEVIVADGGSHDATRTIAVEAGARVVETPKGRAVQMNAGAELSMGRHLIFLHADTLLPEGFATSIRQMLDDPTAVAGAFRFRTDSPTPGMRLMEWGTNLRATVLQCPYGDQALFMTRRVFSEMGGFSPLPVMEDFELVRRLRRRGRIALLPDAVTTSARRWQKLGIARTVLRNQFMVAGYLAGMPPERLRKLYDRDISGT